MLQRNKIVSFTSTSTNANCRYRNENKEPPLNALTLHMLPPSTLPQASPLLRLRLRVTRLLQCSEAFGFDDLARLLLLGAHDVGLIERGLNDAANKSVTDRESERKGVVEVIRC